MISLVLVLDEKETGLEYTLNSIKKQDYRGETEIILLSHGKIHSELKQVVKKESEDKTASEILRNTNGEIFLFLRLGTGVGTDMLSFVADATDKRALAGTSLIKPKKRTPLRLLKAAFTNMLKPERNLQYLFFCTRKEYLAEKEKTRIIAKAKEERRFRIVKSFVSV